MFTLCVPVNVQFTKEERATSLWWLILQVLFNVSGKRTTKQQEHQSGQSSEPCSAPFPHCEQRKSSWIQFFVAAQFVLVWEASWVRSTNCSCTAAKTDLSSPSLEWQQSGGEAERRVGGGGGWRGGFTPTSPWGGRAWSLHAWINPIKSALARFSPTPSLPPPQRPSLSLPLTPPHPPYVPPPLYNSIWPGHAASWHTAGRKGSDDELLPVGVIHDDNY